MIFSGFYYKLTVSLPMKKLLVIFLLSTFIVFPLAAEDANKDETDVPNEIVKYDISGFALEISFLNYFNIGLGYSALKARPFYFRGVFRAYVIIRQVFFCARS